MIRRCPSVTAGEEKWIFPFQEEADAMFNTALIYELSALRAQALPLLEMVPECAEEYSEAYRLRKSFPISRRCRSMLCRPLRSCASLWGTVCSNTNGLRLALALLGLCVVPMCSSW